MKTLVKLLAILSLISAFSLSAVRINEFMADNESFYSPGKWDLYDWIEIYNEGDETVNLQGYGLTDDQKDPFKWTFPDVSLAPGGFLLVYASGDTSNKNGLHCNFKLSDEGEYLGMCDPNGKVISEFAPAFPPLGKNKTYGVASSGISEEITLLDNNAECFVSAVTSVNTNWYASDFDDSGWKKGRYGAGYDLKERSEFTGMLGCDLREELYGGSNRVAYTRAYFVVNNGDEFNYLGLKIYFQDAFQLYLNGEKVLTDQNFWQVNDHTQAAKKPRDYVDALEEQIFEISKAVGKLRPGTNVFAISVSVKTTENESVIIKPKLVAEKLLPGEEKIGRLRISTPGSANSGLVTEVAPVSASNNSCVFEQPFDLSLACPTSDSAIWYTLDGTTPTEGKSLLYSEPLRISSTTILRATAFKNKDAGDEFAATYVRYADIAEQGTEKPGPKWPTNDYCGCLFNYGMDERISKSQTYSDLIVPGLKQLPMISIITSPGNLFNATTGIYVNPSNSGDNWERFAHLELIQNDGSSGFSVGCALRIKGNSSRNKFNPKHSLRFVFKNKYGPANLEFPLFGEEGAKAFRKIDLKSAQQFSWHFQMDPFEAVYCRDTFVRYLTAAFGSPYVRSRFYHVLLNGQYWGLYEFEERPEENYCASYFGGTKDVYDVLKADKYDADSSYRVQVKNGDFKAWQILFSYAKTFVSDSVYNTMLGRDENGQRDPSLPILLDATNVVDFTIVNNITSNDDCPLTSERMFVNNFYALYNKVSPDGFKFISHDNEYTLMKRNEQLDFTGTISNSFTRYYYFFNPRYLHQHLIGVADYRQIFISKVCETYFNSGPATVENMRLLFKELSDSISYAVVCESARWGASIFRKRYSQQPEYMPYERNRDWQKEVDYIMDEFFPIRHELTLKQYRERGWFPDCDPPRLIPQGGRYWTGTEVTATGCYQIVYTTDGSDPWTSPTAKPLKESVPVNGSLRFRCCYSPDEIDVKMEAAADYTVSDECDVVVTEMMYDPLKPSEEEKGDGSDPELGEVSKYEYLEFYNRSESPVDLANFYLKGTLEFTLPNSPALVPPKSYALLVASKKAFFRRYPESKANILAEYDGSIKADIVKLTLPNYAFSINADWFSECQGKGYSIELKDNRTPYGKMSERSSWQASEDKYGSPGYDPGEIPEPTAFLALLLLLSALFKKPAAF